MLLKSHNPLVLCETVEEKRFESLVRAVAGELQLRALRETAQDFAGSARTLVLVGPNLPPKLELDDIEVRFPFDLPGPEELRSLVSDTVRRLSRETPRTRVELSREDVEGLVSDLQGLTMFEAERALARAVVEDNALTGADRPHVRESKKMLVEGGGLLEFVAAPEGLDQISGLGEIEEMAPEPENRILPATGRTPDRSAEGNPASGSPGPRQEPRRPGGRDRLGGSPSVARTAARLYQI